MKTESLKPGERGYAYNASWYPDLKNGEVCGMIVNKPDGKRWMISSVPYDSKDGISKGNAIKQQLVKMQELGFSPQDIVCIRFVERPYREGFNDGDPNHEVWGR